MTEALRVRDPETALLPLLLPFCAAAAEAAAGLVEAARAGLAERLAGGGRVSAAALEAEQFAAHGLAWAATYAAALRELARWAADLDAGGRLGEIERLILQIGFGEYLAQLAGGIAMSQTEIVRPHDLGVDAAALSAFRTPEVEALIAAAASPAARARLVELMRAPAAPRASAPPASTTTSR